jgi:serine/threonine protein kinase
MQNRPGQPGENDLRVSDFGLSRMVGPQSFMKTMCGTPQYLAPEILIESAGGAAAPRGYDKAVDLWSLGCILYILLSGLAPFSCRGDDQDGLRRLIREGRFNFPAPQWTRVSTSAKDLVRKLLTVNPAQRYTIEQAEEHPWMLAGGRKRKETASATTAAEAGMSAEKKRQLAQPAAAAAAAAGAATARLPFNGQ